MRVLFVDDEPKLLEQAENFLEKENERLDIYTVSSAEKGLKNLKQEDFDAIVADYKLPGMDGLEFLKTVRENGTDIPFIIFTGKGREEIAMEALNLEADRYLQKGGDPKSQYELLANAIVKQCQKREAEEKAEAYRKDLNETFDALQESTMLLDSKHNILYANEKTANLYDISKESMIGEKCYNVIHESEEPIDDCPLEKTIQSKSVEESEFYEPDLDKYFLSRAYPITGDGEEMNKAVHQNIDITERTKMEKNLRESKKRLSTIYELNPTSITLSNLEDGKYVEVNEAFTEITGWKRKEAIGKTDSELNIWAEPADEQREELLKMLEEKGFVENYECTFQDKEGNEIPALLSAKIITSNDERYMLANVLNIKERKKARAALKESKERFEKLFETAPDPIFIVNRFAELEDVNQVLCETLGVEKKELIGKGILDLSLLTQESQEKLLRNFKKEIEGSEEASPYEIELNTTEDEVVYAELNATPLKKEGEIDGAIGVARDITERKKLEERKKFLHSLLRHDLKNKVTAIDGYLDLLRDSDLSNKQEEFVEKMEKVCEDSDELIEKVRTLRKIGEEEKTEKTDLNPIIENVIEERKTHAEEKGIQLSHEKCEETVYGGPLLEELFFNLVENSIEHSGCNLIELSCEVEDEYVVVNIEDDGCGIPDEDKAEVLKKGVTRGETGGSGLGMFLVNQIAESYNGELEIKDSELEGTQFKVYLKKV